MIRPDSLEAVYGNSSSGSFPDSFSGSLFEACVAGSASAAFPATGSIFGVVPAAGHVISYLDHPVYCLIHINSYLFSNFPQDVDSTYSSRSHWNSQPGQASTDMRRDGNQLIIVPGHNSRTPLNFYIRGGTLDAQVLGGQIAVPEGQVAANLIKRIALGEEVGKVQGKPPGKLR